MTTSWKFITCPTIAKQEPSMNLVGICNIATAIAAIIHQRRIPPYLVCLHNGKKYKRIQHIYTRLYIMYIYIYTPSWCLKQVQLSKWNPQETWDRRFRSKVLGKINRNDLGRESGSEANLLQIFGLVQEVQPCATVKQSKCATGWLLRCVMIMWDSNAGDLGHIQSCVKTRHLTVCLPGIPTSGAFSKTCCNLTAWRDSHQHSSSACTPAHSHQPGQHCPI